MTIFPGLVSDVDKLIVNNCDTNSLIQLSRVNTQLYQIFSNNEFFKDLFQTQHPALFDLGHFKTLRSYHPSNCWKVMSQLIDSSRTKSEFPKLTGSFVEEAKSHFLVEEQSKKQQLTEQMKEICGSYYEDPNSPIDKAWKAMNKCSEEISVVRAKLRPIAVEIEKQLQLIKEPLSIGLFGGGIADTIGENPRKFQNITEEEFMTIPEEEREGMSIEFLPHYRILADLIASFQEIYDSPEFTNLVSEQETFEEKYNALESKRLWLDSEINDIDREIATFLADPAGGHRAVLAKEFSEARTLEDRIGDEHLLDKCAELINQLIKDPSQKTPENLNRVRSMINACNHDRKNYIWGQLYYHFANNIMEDQWSEKHFQDHLVSLISIIYSYTV